MLVTLTDKQAGMVREALLVWWGEWDDTLAPDDFPALRELLILLGINPDEGDANSLLVRELTSNGRILKGMGP